MRRQVTNLQPWECLMKRIVWKQLGNVRDKKILDFGSGIGVTADYLAEHNDVIICAYRGSWRIWSVCSSTSGAIRMRWPISRKSKRFDTSGSEQSGPLLIR